MPSVSRPPGRKVLPRLPDLWAHQPVSLGGEGNLRPTGRRSCLAGPNATAGPLSRGPAVSQAHQGRRRHTWPATVRGASTDPPCWRPEARSSLTGEGRGPSELPVLPVRGPDNARPHWSLCRLGMQHALLLLGASSPEVPNQRACFLPTFRVLLFSLLHNF